MLAIAEREGHPCTKLTLEGAKLRAGQCPNCSFRRSVAADALILASGCVPPRTAGVEP